MRVLEERGLYGDPPGSEIARWRRDKGDDVLRLQYALNAESIVVDAGGYKGQWTSDIHGRFRCHVHVFEPIPQFATHLEWRFEQNPRIIVHDVGLSGADEQAVFSVADDSTSRYRSSATSVSVRLVDAAKFLSGLGLERIDLMKINIEGAEYELLENLARTGYIASIAEIQVQFHDIFPDSAARLTRARATLAQTHSPRYQYDFVWESWYRKDAH